MKRGLKIMAVATAVCAGLIGASAAPAAGPISQGYGNPVATQGAVTPPSSPAVQPSGTLAQTRTLRGSTLPFTGIDLMLLSCGGAGLLLVGASLRRLGRVKA
jgi:hypothetical protein